LRIKPQRGQVSENSSKSPRSESWAVFHEDVSGSNFANDAGHVVPHAAAFSIKPRSVPGNADVLAREPSRHDVNNSAPWLSVKRLHVIPNRERREGSIVLSCHKHGLSVRLPLDGADCSVSKQLPCEDAATSACEKMKLIHNIHEKSPALQGWLVVGYSQHITQAGPGSGCIRFCPQKEKPRFFHMGCVMTACVRRGML
jgi:hypothetical protein